LASPRKSQTKSQRRPTSGDTQRRQATVTPGQVPTERHRATSSDARNVTGGQGVAGSNPAVPTGNRPFSNIHPLRKSQQKSQLVVQRPLHRPPPRACHRAPPGHAPTQNNRQAHQSKRQRSLSHPGPAHDPGHHPRPPADRRPDAHPGHHSRRTRASHGAPTRPAHAAVNARRPASEPPPGRAAATAATFTTTWKQGRIPATAKVPSRSANAMH
jgi:hypothetical protein